MTNPGNAIGTNAAYNGRTSVNAFNDILAGLSRGVLSGWECKPSTGMTITLGGNGTTRDVAVAEDNAGNKTTINNISGSPISVTIAAAPGANSRIDAIVGYVDGSAKGSGNTDNPECCGIIAVPGTTASNPSAPADSAIRSAITSDGANGTSAYYVVLATVRVTAGLTTITQNNITAGAVAKLTQKGTVGSNNVDFATMRYSTSEPLRIGTWIDGQPLLRKVVQFNFDRAKGVEQSISIGLTKEQVKRLDAYYNETSGSSGLPMYEQTDIDKFSILVKNGNLVFRVGSTWPANGTIIAYVDYTDE